MTKKMTTPPTFEQWLQKYFDEPKTELTYREKISKKRYTKAELRKRYKKAYNN